MIKIIVSDLSNTFLFVKDKEWQGSLNGYYDQKRNQVVNFWDHYDLDTEYLEYIKSFELPMYVFTSGVIQKTPELATELEKYFKKIFNPENVKPDESLRKDNPDSFEYIAEELKVEPSEILFIDDNPGFIQAANIAGFTTVQYSGLDYLKEKLKDFTFQQNLKSITNGIQEMKKSGNITVEEIFPEIFRATSVNSKYIIEYDRSKCIGAASCAAIAPLTFFMDDENKALIKNDSVDFDSDPVILEGAESCPVFAIKIIDKESGEVIFPIE